MPSLHTHTCQRCGRTYDCARSHGAENKERHGRPDISSRVCPSCRGVAVTRSNPRVETKA